MGKFAIISTHSIFTETGTTCLSRNQIGRSGFQVKKENEKLTIVCSRSPHNLEVGHFTLFVLLQPGSKEMYQNLKRTFRVRVIALRRCRPRGRHYRLDFRVPNSVVIIIPVNGRKSSLVLHENKSIVS